MSAPWGGSPWLSQQSGGAVAESFPLQAETTTLLAAMTVQPDATRQAVINRLIYRLKFCGSWVRKDRLWMNAAHHEQAARLEWKNPGTDTLIASANVQFIKDRGFKGNGVDAELHNATFFAAYSQYKQNDASYGFWVVDTKNNDYIGGSLGGNVTLLAQSGVNTQCSINGPAATFPQPKNAVSGLFVVNRSSSASIGCYQDGKSMGPVVASTSSAPYAAAPMYFLNGSGVYSFATIAMGMVGASVDWTAAAEYAAFREYMLAVGVISDFDGEYSFDFMTTPSIKSPEGYVIPVRVAEPQIVRDWENVYYRTQNLEIPFSGYRHVYNLLTGTDTLATQTVAVSAGTHVMSFTGTGSVAFSGAVSGSPADLAGQGAAARVAKQITTTAGNLTITVTDDVRMGQLEDVTYQTNKNPAEYVSKGTLVIPYHGANVDGVKNFTTQNGNTVSAELVTEAPGAALTPFTVIRGLESWNRSKNLLLQTEDFSVTWTPVGAPTLTGAAKRCGKIALSLVGDADGALNGYTQVPAAFTAYADELNVKAFSVVVSQGSSASSVLRLRDTVAAADRGLLAITWSGGLPVVAMTTGTYDGYEPALCDDGSPGFRLMFRSTTVTVANAHIFEMYPATDAALATGANGDIYWGGVQLEDYDVTTPYIANTTAANTRAALYLNEYQYGGLLWANGSEGTFVVDATLQRASGHAYLFQFFNQHASGERAFMNFYREEVPQAIASQCFTASVQQSSLAHRAWADGARHKIAYALKANRLADCLDGGAVATDTSATMPVGFNGIIFFGASDGSSFKSSANSYIHGFKYKQTALADASLQSETQ